MGPYTFAMANPPLSPAQFLLALLNAVHELTGRRPPPTWTHVDKVQTKLATGNRDADRGIDRIAVVGRELVLDLVDMRPGRRRPAPGELAHRAQQGGQELSGT